MGRAVVALVTSSGLTWEVARAGGLVAYGLLTASVAIGLVVSLKWRSSRWTRFITTELHRFVTLLALIFTAIHTLAVLIDPFIRFTPVDVLVPLVSHYRPLWVALGIVGMYLLLAIYASEWFRPRVGYGWWRRFHYLSFVAFGLALVHGLGTGSDSRTPWAIGMYAASAALVGALTAVRALPPRGQRWHPVAAGVTASALILGCVWAWQGPLQPGWNAIANDGHGSGGVVLGVALSGAAAPASPSPTGSPPAAQAFTDTMSGQLAQASDGTVVISAALQRSGDQLTLRFQLTGDGRLVVAGATVSLQAPNGDTCDGLVQRLDRNTLVAACRGATSGAAWLLRLALSADNSGLVQGSISATSN
ncbi:MAG: ferric reductase-like transmembrane domain-containing protein [Candidatus Limnocylindrales bacterium]